MKPTTKKIRREEMKRTKIKDRVLPTVCNDRSEELISAPLTTVLPSPLAENRAYALLCRGLMIST
jgi:hypothetical protein